MLHTGGGWGETPYMIVKCFGCTAIHNKALYKCIIHNHSYKDKNWTVDAVAHADRQTDRQTRSLTYTQGHRGPLKARLRVNTIRLRLMESRQARDKCDFISTSLERLSVQIADEEMWFPSFASSRILLYTLSVIPEHVFKVWPWDRRKERWRKGSEWKER